MPRVSHLTGAGVAGPARTPLVNDCPQNHILPAAGGDDHIHAVLSAPDNVAPVPSAAIGILLGRRFRSNAPRQHGDILWRIRLKMRLKNVDNAQYRSSLMRCSGSWGDR